PVKLGTGFPAGSSAVTWTAGLMAAPATVVLGCWVNAHCVAVPGVMSNAVLVTGRWEVRRAVNVCTVPALPKHKRKLATPFTAATVVVPPSVLLPGLLPSATATLPVKVGTGFPAGSSAVTRTAGLIATPATALDG